MLLGRGMPRRHLLQCKAHAAQRRALQSVLMPCLSVCSVQGWQATSKPAFEIHSLERSVKGNSVPMPKSVIRLILNSVLPRLLQRKLLRLLPQELGEYLLQAGKGFSLGGELHAWCEHGLCLSWPAFFMCWCTQRAGAVRRCGLHCGWSLRRNCQAQV